jgi:hypothetical protein
LIRNVCHNRRYNDGYDKHLFDLGVFRGGWDSG